MVSIAVPPAKIYYKVEINVKVFAVCSFHALRYPTACRSFQKDHSLDIGKFIGIDSIDIDPAGLMRCIPCYGIVPGLLCFIDEDR